MLVVYILSQYSRVYSYCSRYELCYAPLVILTYLAEVSPLIYTLYIPWVRCTITELCSMARLLRCACELPLPSCVYSITGWHPQMGFLQLEPSTTSAPYGFGRISALSWWPRGQFRLIKSGATSRRRRMAQLKHGYTDTFTAESNGMEAPRELLPVSMGEFPRDLGEKVPTVVKPPAPTTRTEVLATPLARYTV